MTRHYEYTPGPVTGASDLLADYLRREFQAVKRGMAGLPNGLPGWDDWKFPANRKQQGANFKPDFDETNIGLLFPQNDTSELIKITDQVPHSWDQRSEFRPHVHYIQDEVPIPTFTLEWRIYANGGTVPAFQTISTVSKAFNYTSGTMVQILLFPAITAPANSTSALADFKLYRNDNAVTGDVLFKSFDIHFRSDALGSLEEYTK